MELRLLQANIDNADAKGRANDLNGHRIGLFIDVETGVKYFVINSSNVGAICPRLNSDGKLVVYKYVCFQNTCII